MGRILDCLDRFGDAAFMRHQGRGCTYREAAAAVRAWRSAFPGKSIRPGQVVSVVGSFSPASTLLLLSLLENGNIVVPLDGEGNEDLAIKETLACASYSFRASGEDFLQVNLAANRTHPLLEQLRKDCSSGIILFTSGTTGQPKAAVHAFEKLIGKYARQGALKPMNTMVFLKFDHIGGLNTLFSVLMNGGTMIVAEGRNPASVCGLIEREKVALLPTTPSFLNMLILSKANMEYDLTSLRLIAYGTEPMPDSTLNAVHQVFPGVKLKQTYGLTELGIFSTRSRSDGSTFMSIREDDLNIRVLDGVLHVRADSAMLGYLNAPSPFDAEGWYNTGDKVELESGFLKILGRDSEIINVGGEKVYPSEVESVLLEMDNVREVVVQKKESAVLGNIVMAVFHLERKEELSSLRKRVFEHCRGRLENFKLPRHIEISGSDLISGRLKKTRILPVTTLES